MDTSSGEISPLGRAIAQEIVEAIGPEKIILFGSRARGEASDDSDFDFLIIYDGPYSKREVKLKIRGLFVHPAFSMDLVVLTSGEFTRQQAIPTTIGRIASTEGVVCHG